MFRRRDSAAVPNVTDAEATTARLELPRRVFDVPVAPASHGQPYPHGTLTGRVAIGGDTGPYLVNGGGPRPEPDTRRQLRVGPGIRMRGAIDGCERLVVEGAVEADLDGTEHLVVGEGGRLDAKGEVETAEIGGVFEGALTVRGRLLIRSTGRVRGDIRFGELEIERGGQLAGNVDAASKGPQLATVASLAD